VIGPDEYFGSYEVPMASLHELENLHAQIAALGQATGLHFYWRGQSNASWGVHSSLHRAIARADALSIEDVSEAAVVGYERSIMQEGRDWIRPSVGARLATVDLFARMQHSGVPTRLLDFSRDPLVAAYFACSELPGEDGRLFVVAARNRPSRQVTNSFLVPWRPGKAKPVDWAEALYALDDQEDFLRIARQKGVFVTGGTPSTRPQRRIKSGTKESLKAHDVRRCMSIALALHSWSQAEAALNGGVVRGRTPTTASALTIRIEARHKQSILTNLRGRGYTWAMLFPDVDGLRRYGPVASGLIDPL
jgi:FRG domain